ncbi:hypothetical protein GOB33_22010 [Sinorhizobium meliloti]|nr:hypothetical protein [Sinorhizobium meliloti]
MTVVSSSPKTYNDVAAVTFGPLDKYVPANDNCSPRKGGINGESSRVVRRPAPPASMAPVAPRHGDWMQTASGRKFWPMDPLSEEVFIDDIAHSLSLQCRYAGHCLRFYSVAEHSVHLARHLRWQGVEVALWALLHDASEAYLVDVPRPVKPYLVGYKDAERQVMAAVCERFGLAAGMPAVVHDADNRIIGDELVNLAPMDWHARYDDPLGVNIRCWYPEQAREEFLATFEALMDCRARGME